MIIGSAMNATPTRSTAAQRGGHRGRGDERGAVLAEALTLLDRIADDVPGSAVSTVACLRMDPATGMPTYSRAGHLPLLVIDADGWSPGWTRGAARCSDCSTGGARPDATTALPAGATLLLFTDGLIERRGEDLETGVHRLSAAATRSGAPLHALVDGLLANLVDIGGAADDIAIVAVRRGDPG